MKPPLDTFFYYIQNKIVKFAVRAWVSFAICLLYNLEGYSRIIKFGMAWKLFEKVRAMNFSFVLQDTFFEVANILACS